MTSLSDLPDQTLNEMCCKALGWFPVNGMPDRWWNTLNGGTMHRTPNFCQSLDLVQQYLVPALKNVRQMATYQDHLLQSARAYVLEDLGYSDPKVEIFWTVNAPARVRVLAFLQAVGTEVEE
jgi:hypothetical protein